MWNFWHIKEQGEFSKECVCCLLQKANTFKCHGQTDGQTNMTEVSSPYKASS